MIVPSADSTVSTQAQELLIDADALDRYEEFTSEMHAILQKYEAAMRQMVVRFEILDRDLSIRRNRNPIHHIESRMKTPMSIYDKLLRYGKEPTISNLEEYLMDVAGVRVICSYKNDVKQLMGLLRRQDDLEIVRVKNYIENPKPNGYRSLHVIVRVPVYFMDNKQMVPVEVQIRTIAMDYWASLEHDLKYKAVADLKKLDIADELKACAQNLEEIERRMQILANALDSSQDTGKRSK
ncbi:MAG: (p)ppGpp synthetase [Eggerthellaceae bacterium]|nr:(p)ppGpp synthetase [Eggerthellaceae bacterium]